MQKKIWGGEVDRLSSSPSSIPLPNLDSNIKGTLVTFANQLVSNRQTENMYLNLLCPYLSFTFVLVAYNTF